MLDNPLPATLDSKFLNALEAAARGEDGKGPTVDLNERFALWVMENLKPGGSAISASDAPWARAGYLYNLLDRFIDGGDAAVVQIDMMREDYGKKFPIAADTGSNLEKKVGDKKKSFFSLVGICHVSGFAHKYVRTQKMWQMEKYRDLAKRLHINFKAGWTNEDYVQVATALYDWARYIAIRSPIPEDWKQDISVIRLEQTIRGDLNPESRQIREFADLVLGSAWRAPYPVINLHDLKRPDLFDELNKKFKKRDLSETLLAIFDERFRFRFKLPFKVSAWKGFQGESPRSFFFGLLAITFAFSFSQSTPKKQKRKQEEIFGEVYKRLGIFVEPGAMEDANIALATLLYLWTSLIRSRY